jgi:hypothetical protein
MVNLQDQLTKMKGTYDGVLHGEELKMWVRNQKLMQTTISAEAKSHSKNIMDFINQNLPKTGQSSSALKKYFFMQVFLCLLMFFFRTFKANNLYQS